MSRPLTWLAVGCAGAVALAAALDTVLSSSSGDQATPALPPTTSEGTTANVGTSRLRRCGEDQLALEIEFLDAPVAILRHVRGDPCRQPATAVSVQIVTRRGEGNGLLLGPEGSFAGLFATGVEAVIAFRYSPRCDERSPFIAVVEAGRYSVRERIPVLRCGIGAE